MRSLGILLIILGLYWGAQPYLPKEARIASYVTVPALPVAPVVIAVGAVLLGTVIAVASRRRRSDDISDAPIRSELARRGFSFTDDVGGWRAKGMWDGVALVVRRVSGYEASRFGRPWVIDVSLEGRPEEPWPLTPDRGKIVDVRDHGFSVSIPEVSHRGRQGDFAARVEDIIAARRS
ncbi:MAG: hypothetical protein H0V44_11040 [Planctomycetes bacterium]|nr:hypothetical protein [Planctomycetota bacterium]